MSSAYGEQAKRDNDSGMSGLESRIDMMEQEISGIFENLHQLQSRLYPPRPQPATAVNDGAKSASIENGMNRVLTHLQELRRMSQALLNGG